MAPNLNFRIGSRHTRNEETDVNSSSTSSSMPQPTPDRSETQRRGMFGQSSRASLGLNASSANVSAGDQKKTISDLTQKITTLEQENLALRQRVQYLESTSSSELISQIKKLESDLKEERNNATRFRQLGTAEHPLKAATPEETLFNVCNQKTLNVYFSMLDPRVISQKGGDKLSPDLLAIVLKKIKDDKGADLSVRTGDTLAFADIKAALNRDGREMRDRELNALFPKNTQLAKLGNDVRDGDKCIATDHFECFATMIPFCSDEKNDDNDRRSTEQRILDNSPYIAPDNTTASLYAFHSAANAKFGNASLDQGGRSNFTISDLTPNNILINLAKQFIEVSAQENHPVQTLRRRETFNSQINYQDRRDAALASFELSSQQFGTHKTQMCMIIDKESLRGGNEQDVDNAGRVARKVANLSLKLDDDKNLQIFSHQLGESETLDMRIPGNDINIMRSIQKKGKSPSAVEHIYALLQRFYPGDIDRHPEYRQTPVFCTLVTRSLDIEKYNMLQDAMNLFTSMGLPLFLKLININQNLSQQEIDMMTQLDEKESVAGDDDPLDNINVIQASDPNEITPKNFLHEYADFVGKAVEKQMLNPNQGFDLSKLNNRADRRPVNLI